MEIDLIMRSSESEYEDRLTASRKPELENYSYSYSYSYPVLLAYSADYGFLFLVLFWSSIVSIFEWSNEVPEVSP